MWTTNSVFVIHFEFCDYCDAGIRKSPWEKTRYIWNENLNEFQYEDDFQQEIIEYLNNVSLY